MKLFKSVSLLGIIFGSLFTIWFTASAVSSNNADNSSSPSVSTQVLANTVSSQAEEAGQVVANKIESSVNQVTSQLNNQLINVSAKETTPAPPLVTSARGQIGVTVRYDPAYVGLDFPMGDVPKDRGVCTDVVIRAYREQGKDLQALVNADMKQAWSQYPKIWGLKTTDKNIDHRRVPNLRVFFSRHGQSFDISDYANNTNNANYEDHANNTSDNTHTSNFKAGDLVTWKVSGRPHIGIVSNKTTANGTPLIIHNIGRGTQEEDVLFAFDMTGHYRY